MAQPTLTYAQRLPETSRSTTMLAHKHHHTNRLPTPDASASNSDDSNDVSGSPPASKRLRYDPVLQQSFDVGSAIRPLNPKDWSRSRADSAVHSPPYHAAEIRRPCLPPLKSLLEDNNLSPPKTPSPRQSYREPSPRETLFATPSIGISHVPTSLYPYKRQKTVPGREADLAYASPALPLGIERKTPTAFATRPDEVQIRQPISLPPLSAQLEGLNSYRQTAPTTVPPHRLSPPWTGQFPPTTPLFKLHADRPAFDGHASAHYQTPDRTPLPSDYSRATSVSSYPHDAYAARAGNSREASVHHDHNDPSATRSSFAGPYGGYLPHISERENHGRPHYGNEPRYSFSSSSEGSAGPHEYGPYVGPAGWAGMPGQPYFMPSHLDYQHGKARKRSNLPKQSTEVMKQWFEQNISNPYPSEEQKQRFSSITGISMTQVSNWFINHRRRCPELRDKRERPRGVVSGAESNI